MKSASPWKHYKEKIYFIGGIYHLFLITCSVVLWCGLLFLPRERIARLI
jgi:palmitoyl transferase